MGFEMKKLVILKIPLYFTCMLDCSGQLSFLNFKCKITMITAHTKTKKSVDLASSSGVGTYMGE